MRIIDDKTLQCAMRTYERAGKYVPRKNTYVLARRDFNAWLEIFMAAKFKFECLLVYCDQF